VVTGKVRPKAGIRLLVNGQRDIKSIGADES